MQTKQTSFLSATVLLAACSLVSLLLGIVRVKVFTNFFTTQELDPFFAAIKIPDVITQLISVGAISATVIPVMLSVREEHGETEMQRLVRALFSLGLLLVLCCSGLVFITAPWIVQILTPGFSADKAATTVTLLRIMLFSPIFMSLGSLARSVLNGHRLFLIPALAPIMNNIGIIAATILFAKTLGIYSISWGVALGAFLFFLIQIPAVLDVIPDWRKGITFRHVALRQMGRLAIPRLFSLGVNQIGMLLDTFIASLLRGPAVAIYSLAYMIQNMPVNIFAINTSTVAFTSLVEHASERDWQRFNTALLNALRQGLFFAVPLSILLGLLPEYVVAVFRGNEMTDHDVRLISICVILYAISIWAQSMLYIVIKGFYALHDTLKPFLFSIAAIALKVIILFAPMLYVLVTGTWDSITGTTLGEKLVNIYQMNGYVWLIPLSFSLSQIVNTALLIIFIHRVTKFVNRALFLLIGKLIFMSLVMGIIAWGLRLLGESLLPLTNQVVDIAFLFGIGGISFALYATVAYWIGFPEPQIVLEGLKRRLGIETHTPSEENY